MVENKQTEASVITYPINREPARTLSYRPSIDGLRALAVISVCIFHLNSNWLPGGFVGVDVFFVISGYLITSILLQDHQNGVFSFAKFYQRRIARIFPAFFTVTASALAASYLIYLAQDFSSAGYNMLFSSLSIANISFMMRGNYFAVTADASPYLHYWSLSVEEQFYIFFPIILAIAVKTASKHLVALLGTLFLISFGSCVLLTHSMPTWAFYLLPTRAWELLAGCILATLPAKSGTQNPSQQGDWPSTIGLVTVIISFFVIQGGKEFPGIWPLLPVAGSVAILKPHGMANGIGRRILSFPPLVFVGRLSYSLYLWHWPIYSFVDYKLYMAEDSVRLIWKIGLSLLAATVSYLLIENPSRKFLNARKNRAIAFGLLSIAVVLSIPIGWSIYRQNYVSAKARDLKNGGIVFKGKPNRPTVVIMGDSHASMYGRAVKEICEEQGYRLVVISIAAEYPLRSDNNPLWTESMAILEKEHPKYLIFVCCWTAKLGDNKDRLISILATLEPYTERTILLTQPPVIPIQAAHHCVRQELRMGAKLPFIENSTNSSRRHEINTFLLGLKSPDIWVIDADSRFENENREIKFLNERGRQLYYDWNHISEYGVDLIRAELTGALTSDQQLPSQK